MILLVLLFQVQIFIFSWQVSAYWSASISVVDDVALLLWHCDEGERIR